LISSEDGSINYRTTWYKNSRSVFCRDKFHKVAESSWGLHPKTPVKLVTTANSKANSYINQFCNTVEMLRATLWDSTVQQTQEVRL